MRWPTGGVRKTMIAATFFTAVDWTVLVAYFAVIVAVGYVFWKRNRSADDFTAGGRSLPGWLCGMSIFATYLSSISYFALPGKAFLGNWNAFVFSIAIPPAAWIAVRYFLPMYRRSNEVSAYSLLETRFGLWARLFASAFYLVFHVARVGVILYLMGLPMAILFGWDIRCGNLGNGSDRHRLCVFWRCRRGDLGRRDSGLHFAWWRIDRVGDFADGNA